MSIQTVKLSDVVEQEVEWLVPQYIPKNEITILAGDGGVGKTILCCSIVADASKGKFANGIPQKVLFLNDADNAKYLASKLNKLGAKLEYINFVNITDSLFKNLKFGSPYLERLLTTENFTLVVFDPIQAFVPIDSYLQPKQYIEWLLELGRKTKTTFLITMNTNKRQYVSGRERMDGSSAIWDMAKSVLLMGKTEQDGIGYISQEKNSYGKLEKTMLYKINDDGIVDFRGYTRKKDCNFIDSTQRRNHVKNSRTNRRKS
jgi:predicted ATP-dependent serine protease